MLSQLVYVSNRNANCTEDEIGKILAACEKNNPSLGITGVLLYSDTKFVQLVEGDAKSISGLYDKIKMDTRHSKPMMISYGPVKEKSFPSWHMGAKSFSGNEIDFKSEISEDDKAVFDNLLKGEPESGKKVLTLLKKFF